MEQISLIVQSSNKPPAETDLAAATVRPGSEAGSVSSACPPKSADLF